MPGWNEGWNNNIGTTYTCTYCAALFTHLDTDNLSQSKEESNGHGRGGEAESMIH